MKKLFYVTLFALVLSLVWNFRLFSENIEFKHFFHRCLSKIDPADLYNQYQIYTNNRDEKSAKCYLSISAQLGYAEAQFKLAKLLMDEGEEKLAEVWMIEAAKQGNAEHQYELGRWYDYVFDYKSPEEHDKFERLAFIWYEKAAVQNQAEAAEFLAQCYRLGSGCVRDLSAAEYWYKRAFELGQNVNRGLAEVYIETGRPELAEPLLSYEAADGSIQCRNRLNTILKNNPNQLKKTHK